MAQGALGWSSLPAGVASLRFAWWRMYDAAGVDRSFGRGANAVVALQLLLAVEVSRHPPVCAYQVDADLTPSLSSPNGRVFSVDLCANRHVVRLYEVYETPDKVYIVLENCPCGDLEKMLYLRG